jgi:hypothetical protein
VTPDEEVLAFEALVVRAVMGATVEALDNLITFVLLALNITAPPNPVQAAQIGHTVARRIRETSIPPVNRTLARKAMDARDLGTIRAVQALPAGPLRDLATTANWRADTQPSVPNADRAIREGLEAVVVIASTGLRNRTEAASVAGKLKATKARAQGIARYVAHEGINAGIAEVARTIGHRLLWVAERNACLHCLAHAGYAVEPGSQFPGVSFDPASAKVRPVPHPPLHPNCRCEVRTFAGPAGPPPTDRSSTSPAARLAAEARRSVVYQWTDYASGSAQERAARTLLNAGAGLPSSVEKRARIMLKQGGKRNGR